MPQDPSADAGADHPVPAQPVPDDPDVVEWGGDGFARRPPRRRASPGRLDRLIGDRWLAAPAVAALGMAAVFGSLVVQWGQISIRRLESGGGPRVEIGTAATDLGGLSAGYVVGVLAVAALAGVAIFGTPPARSNARVAGAATAAGVLAVLIAATVSLDAAVRRTYAPIWPELDVQVAYGPGLVLAYLATATMGLALYLAARSDARSPAAEIAAEPPAASVGRRRSRAVRSGSEEDAREVTVRPTAPFARPEWEDRYR